MPVGEGGAVVVAGVVVVDGGVGPRFGAVVVDELPPVASTPTPAAAPPAAAMPAIAPVERPPDAAATFPEDEMNPTIENYFNLAREGEVLDPRGLDAVPYTS